MIQIKKKFHNKKRYLFRIKEYLRSAFVNLFKLTTENDKPVYLAHTGKKIYIACLYNNRLVLASVFYYHIHSRSNILTRSDSGARSLNNSPYIIPLFEEVMRYIDVKSYRVNHFLIDLDPVIKGFLFDAGKDPEILKIMIDYMQENEEEYTFQNTPDWSILVNNPTWNNLASFFIK